MFDRKALEQARRSFRSYVCMWIHIIPEIHDTYNFIIIPSFESIVFESCAGEYIKRRRRAFLSFFTYYSTNVARPRAQLSIASWHKCGIPIVSHCIIRRLPNRLRRVVVSYEKGCETICGTEWNFVSSMTMPCLTVAKVQKNFFFFHVQ